MKKTIEENLDQLKSLLQVISENDYTKRIDVLSNSTIGQHIRHILEFYLKLVSLNNQTISYDSRKRDKTVEESPQTAIQTLHKIRTALGNLKESDQITLIADFTKDGSSKSKIISSYAREMAYCLEHSIHHQALIKAGLTSLQLQNLVDKSFGVAYSTLQFQNKICVQ